MIGTWKIELSKEVTGDNANCGSDLPNSIEGDLKLGDYHNYMSTHYGVGKTLVLELTLDTLEYNNVSSSPNRKNWFSLAVKSDGEAVGKWTAVYDQGFKIDLHDGTTILTYFYFEPIEDKRYATNTNKSSIGWASKKVGNVFKHFCSYAEKVNPPKIQVFNTVDLTENDFQKFGREVVRIMKNGVKTFRPVGGSEWSESDGNYFCKCSNRRGSSTPGEKLPKNFSWDRFDNIPIVDQKKCGGCYTIASLFVLQSRFIIAVGKLLHNPNQEKDARLLHLEKLLNEKTFDINQSLSCTPFNQGCSGGYPLNTGMYANMYGLVLNGDKVDDVRDDVHCSSSEDGDDSVRLYAKDYDYVGGCYECTQCSGEELIMREIYENGPVVAGLDGGYIRHYKEGVVDPPETELRTHQGMCEFPNNQVLSGFEYTTHAVAIIGWGESDGFKYWVVRNSWGKNWGDKGFFKLARGRNAFGIESEAVVLDPDVDRFLNNTKQQPISNHKSNSL
ncbi:cysteine proteinase [Theileria orientalis]|uniref:Dipeptidyl peptidase 1 n=1 Tax=Theileria orientalis TaxID=68886 RepID=A0A976MBP2_THEOR|nr:cysteine proteinase [Theileria orientalis]